MKTRHLVVVIATAIILTGIAFWFLGCAEVPDVPATVITTTTVAPVTTTTTTAVVTTTVGSTTTTTGAPTTTTTSTTSTTTTTLPIGAAWQRATASAFGSGGKFKFQTLVYDSKLWAIGGALDNNPTTTNEVWYSTNGSNWTMVTQSSPLRSIFNHSSAVFDAGKGDRIWVIGGKIFDPVTASFYVTNEVYYSLDGTDWNPIDVAKSFSPVFAHSSVVFDGKLWVIGGITYPYGGASSEVWSSTDGSNWNLVTIAPFGPRMNHTSVVHDNKIWVIGGGIDGNPTPTNEVWSSPDGINWTKVTPVTIFPARHAHSSVVSDGKMFVIGGYRGSTPKVEDDVWSSTDGATWTQLTAAAAFGTRFKHASAVFDNKIWVISGTDLANNQLNDVWYSPKP
jgi:hypothetical protein